MLKKNQIIKLPKIKKKVVKINSNKSGENVKCQ